MGVRDDHGVSGCLMESNYTCSFEDSMVPFGCYRSKSAGVVDRRVCPKPSVSCVAGHFSFG